MRSRLYLVIWRRAKIRFMEIRIRAAISACDHRRLREEDRAGETRLLNGVARRLDGDYGNCCIAQRLTALKRAGDDAPFEDAHKGRGKLLGSASAAVWSAPYQVRC